MTPTLPPRGLVPCALLLALACGSSDGPTPPPSPTGPFTNNACPLGTKVGELRVAMAEQYTAVSGSIAAAVVPMAGRDVVVESGGCRLLRARLLRCDPACAGGMTCAEGGRCIAYPENLDAGTITLQGLRRPVTMKPRPPGNLYWDTELPHPGFDPGATIEARATGGQVQAFALRGRGTSPLELPPQELRLEADRDFAISWTPGPPGPAQVVLTIDIDQHGVTPATLVCEAADSGTMTVPATIVGELVRAGTSGYPKARLARRTVDAAVLAPGCVELVIATELERSPSVGGHIPCTRDAECPGGLACAAELQSCRAP